jgi:hypothetical protein
MKKSTFILAILCLSFSAYSQFSIGIKGGIGAAFTPTDTKEFVSLSPTNIDLVSVGGSALRQSIGLSVLNENEKVFFMVDGVFTQATETFQLISTGLGRSILDPSLEYQNNTSNIRLIATAGAKYKDFRVGFGPEISFVVDQQEDLSERANFEVDERNYLGGFNLLVGYKLLDRLQLDLKYVKYFDSVGAGYSFENIPLDFDSSTSLVELTLGYYFN